MRVSWQSDLSTFLLGRAYSFCGMRYHTSQAESRYFSWLHGSTGVSLLLAPEISAAEVLSPGLKHLRHRSSPVYLVRRGKLPMHCDQLPRKVSCRIPTYLKYLRTFLKKDNNNTGAEGVSALQTSHLISCALRPYCLVRYCHPLLCDHVLEAWAVAQPVCFVYP